MRITRRMKRKLGRIAITPVIAFVFFGVMSVIKDKNLTPEEKFDKIQENAAETAEKINLEEVVDTAVDTTVNTVSDISTQNDSNEIVGAIGELTQGIPEAAQGYTQGLSDLTQGYSQDLSALTQNIMNMLDKETTSEDGGYTTFNSDITYTELNNNQPFFSDDEKKCTEAFEKYSDLDKHGRCGVAYANICKELMPTEERGEIGHIKPSGWHTVKYPEVIKDKYLYNRCHLIAFCLAGENDNEKNLITGTRYFNVEGMLPFEEEVLYYVKRTGNHVLYRVNPVFEGNNLIASGVTMEAYSVEDNGQGVCFYVFVYNKQPGIEIDYATGDSKQL